jgi:pSer/pThr/pTyr-binding forkhead associated (FHA) protein
MSLKTWMLSGMNRVFTRSDLPPRTVANVSPSAPDAPRVEPILRPAGGRAPGKAEYLGRYGPLIGAIREALEEFVAHHLRLHLAIAERDRYMLTSIAVETEGGDEARDLVTRFAREFAPEQIRHFLAKEVIARLPNASAIDLSQFAGLDLEAPDADEGGAYADLMNELRRGEASGKPRAFKVALVGRWSDGSAQQPGSGAVQREASPSTPLATRELVLDVEDADGARRAQLRAVPGRRYLIGKDPACDIVVNGVYASRRHCEVWLDHGTWWVTDSGSTNGVRVEAPRGAGSARGGVSINGDGAVLEVVPGAHIVLSAAGQGSAADYPRLGWPHVEGSTLDAAPQVPATPVTPIVAPAAMRPLLLKVATASGTRMVEVDINETLRVGRSRNQDVVIDWAHQGVSGHHVDIVECDPSGAVVIVHGDNGVSVDGVSHRAGTRFRWSIDQPMLLARALDGETPCALTLERRR